VNEVFQRSNVRAPQPAPVLGEPEELEGLEARLEEQLDGRDRQPAAVVLVGAAHGAEVPGRIPLCGSVYG
jgi:hypothetical protein